MDHYPLLDALARARDKISSHVLVVCPAPQMLALLRDHARLCYGRFPLELDLTSMPHGAVRMAFIHAICSGRPVLASGLHTLDELSLSAALDGLASISQWNPGSGAIGASSKPLSARLPESFISLLLEPPSIYSKQSTGPRFKS